MRKCPICNSEYFEVLWHADFLVPDGWTQPDYLDWKRCDDCGMIYGDNPVITQKDYDKYYIERYGYGVIGLESTNTLKERAVYISKHFAPDVNILDFGGGESGLPTYLRELGFDNTTLVGCGDPMPKDIDVAVAHHVLEHIYDLDEAMDKIVMSLKWGGTLIIDVPDSGAMAFEDSEFPIGDYTQVHINHFRIIDMLKLMRKWGFELKETQSYHARFGTARIYVFIMNPRIIGDTVKKRVTGNIERNFEVLRELGDKEVCFWGLGDIAEYCLANVPLNIKYFIDNNPAFRGATVRGLPVYEKPIDNLPIVVIAQAQKDRLLAHIASECENEVIVI
jgi:SAM-dependent methyltransferase